MMSKRRSFIITQVSFLVALALSILPLSNNIASFNPQWLLLVTVYWAMFEPQRSGIINAWLWGLLLDVAVGTHFGIHALPLAFASYLTIMLHQQLRMYPLWQQAFFVWVLASFDKLVAFQLMTFFSPQEVSWLYWLTPFVSTLFWPAMLALMILYRQLTQSQ